jgi:transketolase
LAVRNCYAESKTLRREAERRDPQSSEMTLEVVNRRPAETPSAARPILTGSNLTKTKNETNIAPGQLCRRFIHYGIREHGMAAAMNGMALHGGVIPYSARSWCFSDYCVPRSAWPP